MALEVLILAAVVLLLLPTVQAQGPPVDDSKECLAYAYSKSEVHLFLVDDGKALFGNNLTIVHNCDRVSIYFDNEFQASSSSNFTIPIQPGTFDITIQINASNTTFENITVFPDRLDWEYQYQMVLNFEEPYIAISESDFQINYAVGFSIVIVWVLAVYVYWSLINAYVERNFIEEVIQ
jgi:hypothetical protein